MSKIRVTQIRSIIGATKRQRMTLQTLGLRRIHQTVELDSSESVVGAIRKVNHLVEIETL
ncbi:MAG: 50S ribosomal protein L30 [Bacteroides sp.]